ncbi:MAG TPA: FAD-dependent oxidoreductase [Mycobacteriales bacterium]|nr:FAD-dependent oxidoreductase [Mycobacteriales bacterium]
MRTDPRIVIIGAGPTGLGAGYRLNELGYDDWVLLEANDYVGGLATSFTDENDFTWDIGGHVMFSHYDYYDKLVARLMGDEYTTLHREAWVWMEDRFIPYPFQNNIGGLEPQTVFECLTGAISARYEASGAPPANFREWVLATMGQGIADHFMIPYNFKVWATPGDRMSFNWIGERVSVVDVEDLLRNVLFDKPETQWGPNSTFKYPLRGGTGFLYDGMRQFVEHKLELECPVASVDPVAKVVTTRDGRSWPYDVLLSTMPLNKLIASTESVPAAVSSAVNTLEWSGSHIVGIGVDRPVDSEKNWIYFPEPDVPFYRVTYLSNYSPHLTAHPEQFSLLTETSHSTYKEEDPELIVERVIDGLVSTGLMLEDDRERIATRWRCSPDMSYPVPTVGRDEALGTVQPWLRTQDIWSRGRFGAWLYEIGNMDHSCMQGVEWVNHVLNGEPETVWIPRGEGEAGAGIR